MTTKTITNLNGDSERVSLPAPHFTASPRGRENLSTGIWLTGLYSGPRTGRKFARTYSIWQSKTGYGVIGETYCELTEAEYLHYCNVVGCEPVNVAVTEA